MSEVGDNSESLESFESGSMVDEMVRQNIENRVDEATSPEGTRSPEEQANFEYLVQYYGDTQFEWGGHVGDIAYVLESCPMGRWKLSQGIEAVIEWADRRRVVVEEPDEEEAAPEDESVVDAAAGDATTKKNSEEVSDSLPTEKSRKKTQPEKDEVVAPIVASAAFVAALPVVKQAQQPSDSSVDAEPRKTEVAVPERDIPIVVEKDAFDTITAKDEADVPEVAVVAPEVQSEDGLEMMAEDVEIVSAEPEHDTGRTEDVLAASIAAEQNEQHDESQEEVIEETDRDVAEIMDAWAELAEKETPLDEFFVAMIDQLNSEVEDIPESEELDLDQELGSEVDSLALDELRTLLVEVQTIRTAMDRLHTARTRKECEVRVEEVVVSVVKLLRALGYENPEKMIRDFMYAHPLASLEEIVDELERTLKRSIQYETYRITQTVHHRRRNGFGRLALFVLRTLSLRTPTTDLVS